MGAIGLVVKGCRSRARHLRKNSSTDRLRYAARRSRETIRLWAVRKEQRDIRAASVVESTTRLKRTRQNVGHSAYSTSKRKAKRAVASRTRSRIKKDARSDFKSVPDIDKPTQQSPRLAKTGSRAVSQNRWVCTGGRAFKALLFFYFFRFRGGIRMHLLPKCFLGVGTGG